MIKIFSNIRRKLISENNSIIRNTNYFKYAIGEIFLIVIGILIALGINNWREGQQENKLEIIILDQITGQLKKDSLALHELIIQMEETSLITQELKKYMKENNPYTDSLKGIFSRISYFNQINHNQTSYDKLMDAGINIVKNDSIQNLIPMYFRNMEHLSAVYDRYPISVYFRDEIYPKYFKSFSWGPEGSEPNDFELLKKNDEFYIALDYVINDTRFYRYSYLDGAELNHRLLRLLKKELTKRIK